MSKVKENSVELENRVPSPLASRRALSSGSRGISSAVNYRSYASILLQDSVPVQFPSLLTSGTQKSSTSTELSVSSHLDRQAQHSTVPLQSASAVSSVQVLSASAIKPVPVPNARAIKAVPVFSARELKHSTVKELVFPSLVYFFSFQSCGIPCLILLPFFCFVLLGDAHIDTHQLSSVSVNKSHQSVFVLGPFRQPTYH